VLVDSSGRRPGRAPGWLRQALREQGYAVRRGETFPGLHADWLRIAVRDAETSTAFVAAVERCVG
jgi:histidinol-phosphate/aromatic aminotransferase/cobyric acid decarboxylase-like protein